MPVQKCTAKDLRGTFLESAELQQHFAGNAVTNGGPVPSASLQVLQSTSAIAPPVSMLPPFGQDA